TIGHALEVEHGHAELLHGEAVAFGIAVATAVGVQRGLCPRLDGDRILGLLASYELPPRIAPDRARGALRRLGAIRLARGNRLNFVIPLGIDRVRIEPEVADAELAEALDHILAWVADARGPSARDTASGQAAGADPRRGARSARRA